MKLAPILLTSLLLAMPGWAQQRGMVDHMATGSLPTCSTATPELYGYRVYDTTANEEMTCSETENTWVPSRGTNGPVAQDTVIFCGELGANTDEFFAGPGVANFIGGVVDLTPGAAGCNTLGDTAVATADAALSADLGYRVNGMWCRVTKGAATTAETVITFVEATANTAVTCTIPLGTDVDCFSADGLFDDVAAGAVVAISSLNGTDDESAEDIICRVSITWQ